MYMALRIALVAILFFSGPVAAETVLYMVSATGDYIGQGNEYTILPSTHTFNPSRNYDNGVSFSITDSGSDYWSVNFAAPDEADLTVGVYTDATRWPFQATGIPGLSISGQGRGCNELFGTFEVKEVVYDVNGQVEKFAADFIQHCENPYAPALTGQIRFNSDVPWGDPPTAPVPFAVLHMVSETGDWIGQGNEYTVLSSTHTFLPSRNYDNGVSFSITAGGGDFWYADFAAPDEAGLTVGVYADATRWPFQAAGVPGLDISGQGRGCNQLFGTFEVKEVVYDVNGQVEKFAADFVQHCETPDAPALTGQIRFNSDVPWDEGTPPTTPPVQLAGLTITASSIYNPYYPASKMLDGNPSSFWAGALYQDSWLVTVDLGGMRTLDEIQIDWYFVYGSDNFDIEYSTDGAIYLPIHVGLSEPGESTPPYVATHVQPLNSVQASHVRIVIHNTLRSVPLISEVRIFGWIPSP